MKARRGLQIFVAVLSIILLVALAAVAVVTYLSNNLKFLPSVLVEFGENFKAGLNGISEYALHLDNDIVIQAVYFGAPGLMLILAVILILTKNKNGKDAKNVAGCIFALIGVVAVVAFDMIFAMYLYATDALLIAYCVNGGVLALFVLFGGLALGIKPKKVAATEAEEVQDTTEAQQEQTAQQDEQPVEQTADENEQYVEQPTFDQPHDEPQPDEPHEEQMEEQVEEEPVQEEESQETPATQYVPQPDVTTHDIVQKTYGKKGGELNSTTLEKIYKVRALYEAKAITEQEYIKLINKYLGF